MIVFYNPHADDFLGEPPHFRILKRRPLKKYGYLLQETLAATGEIRVIVDGTVSAFIPAKIFGRLPTPLRQAIARYELDWWSQINKLKGLVRVHDGRARPGDILFAFSYKAATGAFHARTKYLAQFRTKVFHLSHYFISTQEKSDNLRRMENVVLAGDSDVSSNPYFRHFFSWYEKPFLVLPFSVSARFQVHVPFHERERICVSTGTFHDLDQEIPRSLYVDYLSFFRSATYHPVRKMLYERAKIRKDYIASYISPYRSKSRKTMLSRTLSHFVVSQKSYFGIDIVELYNRYRYAIVGEEASGFPALGAFEAMACGCVLIAQRDYYTGLGLQPGKHFVEHDGSESSIVDAIKWLNINPQRAEDISGAGAAFVRNNLTPEKAYGDAQSALRGLV
jgi:hypothetical protein